MQRKAFTLIELLVVIAIIAILAAILFPVFAQAKRAAKDAAELSNLKQIATSNYLYSGDYDDVTVPYEQTVSPWAAWPILIYPYTKNVDLYYDTAQHVKPSPFPGTPNDWATSGSSWWAWQQQTAVNREAFANDLYNWNQNRSLTSMANLAQRAAFIPGEVQNADGQNSQHWFWPDEASCSFLTDTRTDWWWSQRFNALPKAAVKYHGDGLIVSFGDGHAKKVPRAKYIMDNKSEDEIWNKCRPRNWGPDGSRGTADDLDNDVTKFWGRAWDPSY